MQPRIAAIFSHIATVHSREVNCNEHFGTSFGPGLQEAFADGTMNKEELIEEIRTLKLDTIE